MPCRPVAIRLASISLLVLCCSAGLAATPLVVDELQIERRIAEADAARSKAEHELADWKLTQLKDLRSRGHASWQEVAQQEVTATALAAAAHASAQYVDSVLRLQVRLTDANVQPAPTESEWIRLYLPGSPRLVASISTDDASRESTKRHLDHLRMEHQSLSETELSSLETAIKAARKAVEVYGRVEKDAHLLKRARIRLRLAEAEEALARARRDSARIIARRMSLASNSLDQKRSGQHDPSIGLADMGTRFVDATSDRELSHLVGTMAVRDGEANDQIAWLKQQSDSVSAQIDALQALAEHSHADPAEIEQAKQRKSELDSEILLARDVLAVKRQIADDYEQRFTSGPINNDTQTESPALDDQCFADANTARHLLELDQLKFRTAAKHAATKAQCDYLAERLQRVERIPETARPPKELVHLRHQVRGAEQQLALVQRELSTLDREQDRFCHQVRVQHGERYQLVQSDNGQFVDREQFEVGAALIAVVGFIGDGELDRGLPNLYPYIESATIIDCLTRLSLQAPHPRTEIESLTSSRLAYNFLRLHEPSMRATGRTSNRLQLATDGITYSHDLFCYRPYGLWRVKPAERWAPYEYLRPAGARGFRTFDPYVRYPFAPCGLSIHSYRVGSPTRSSFPYRSNYLYRTAFPIRGNLYSSPYSRRVSAYRGFRDTYGLAGSCFD